jgi:hypothetical protein
VISQPVFHQAGDQVNFWSGWQEGAIITAREAVKSIDRQTIPTAKRGQEHARGNKACNSPSRWSATTATFRSSTAP